LPSLLERFSHRLAGAVGPICNLSGAGCKPAATTIRNPANVSENRCSITKKGGPPLSQNLQSWPDRAAIVVQRGRKVGTTFRSCLFLVGTKWSCKCGFRYDRRLLTAMMLAYTLAFCRLVIGIAFAVSSIGKAANVHEFEETVARFSIFPLRWSKGLSLLFLSGEVAVVVLLFLGHASLPLGFVLAAILLSTFSIALVSVLGRNIQTHCNCFGKTDEPVSLYDIGRNAGLLFCCLGGWILTTSVNVHGNLSTRSWLLIGLLSAIFVTIWVQLGKVVRVLWQT